MNLRSVHQLFASQSAGFWRRPIDLQQVGVTPELADDGPSKITKVVAVAQMVASRYRRVLLFTK
jgi:hypothetical protein